MAFMLIREWGFQSSLLEIAPVFGVRLCSRHPVQVSLLIAEVYGLGKFRVCNGDYL